MTKRIPQPNRSCPRGEHLPPADASPYLDNAGGGKRRANSKLSIPSGALGVPDPSRMVAEVLGTVDDSYEWPALTNIHHFCYPRRHYNSDIEVAFRESPTLKGTMPIQFHNYLHEITEPYEKPSFEVMKLRVDEEKIAKNLYSLGSHAVRLASRAQSIKAQAANRANFQWANDMADYYKKQGQADVDSFRRIVDETEDGMFGILPDRELLSQRNISRAVTLLGRLVAIEALDFRDIIRPSSVFDAT